MVKRISVYGKYYADAMVWVKQRYWHRRKDGIKQRYWHKIERTKRVIKEGRFDFSGSGKDLYRAVKLSRHRIATGYVDVPADEFLRNPDKYSNYGEWLDWEVGYE